MLYSYYICPNCKNKLIKRIQERDYFERYGGECDRCGNRLRIAFTGDKEIDDILYKITFNSKTISDKEKFIHIIMQIYDCEEKNALEMMKQKKYFEVEADVLHTYLYMQLLDKSYIEYSVNPKFPFTRIAYVFCPDCGSETSYKIMEKDVNEDNIESKVQVGFFCETCNEWVAMTIRNKIDMDDTMYMLKFCLTDCDKEEELTIKKIVEELSCKKILSNKITICDNACNIHQILENLNALCIDYDIDPPYPYKIGSDKKKWTEEDLKILMEMNPGLTINLEELNNLN